MYNYKILKNHISSKGKIRMHNKKINYKIIIIIILILIYKIIIIIIIALSLKIILNK